MDIKFKNGSEVHTIGNEGDVKRGYIRGRRLTDKEYWDMVFNEQIKAEEKVSKIIKILGLN